MQQQIPDEWNGRPTKYHLGDGFTQPGIVGKAAYILGFPAVSIIMELYHYNKETKNGEAAATALAQQSGAAQNMIGEEELINAMAPQDGRMQASIISRGNNPPVQQR